MFAASARAPYIPQRRLRSSSGCAVREARAAYGPQPLRRIGRHCSAVGRNRAACREGRRGLPSFQRAGRHAAAERLLRDVAGTLSPSAKRGVPRHGFSSRSRVYCWSAVGRAPQTRSCPMQVRGSRNSAEDEGTRSSMRESGRRWRVLMRDDSLMRSPSVALCCWPRRYRRCGRCGRGLSSRGCFCWQEPDR